MNEAVSKSDYLKRAVLAIILGLVALAIALLMTGCGTVMREYDPQTGRLISELKIRANINDPASQTIVQAPAEPPVIAPGAATAEGSQPPARFTYTTANGSSLQFDTHNASDPSLVWATFGNKLANTGAVAYGGYLFFDWKKAKEAGDTAVALGGQKLDAFKAKEAAKTARRVDDNATRVIRELGRTP